MADAIVWFKTAKAHLNNANDNYNLNNFSLAYRLALDSGESLLKAVLVKNNLFSERDEHHNIQRLFDKIKDNRFLNYAIINQLEDVINGKGKDSFNYINVASSGGAHADCASSQAPNLRYPIDNSSPDEVVAEKDARHKIEQANQLFKILSPLF